ncbi:hypothetical protein Tco_0439786 [Tanacetum coccineum]
MYKVVTTQESQSNEAKCGLSSTGMNAASSVRRPMNRDSHVKNSVLPNSKNPTKKIGVYVRKNKQTDKTSATIVSNKENVIDVDIANTSKAKTLLYVSCMQNVLITCHDKCLANYKLNVHSNVSRALSTNSRTPKYLDTTYVVLKTRFSKKLTQSKSLDTTSVVSKPKIDVGSWQFYDGDLEGLSFQGHVTTNLGGGDLLSGSRESNLYTFFILTWLLSPHHKISCSLPNMVSSESLTKGDFTALGRVAGLGGSCEHGICFLFNGSAGVTGWRQPLSDGTGRLLVPVRRQTGKLGDEEPGTAQGESVKPHRKQDEKNEPKVKGKRGEEGTQRAAGREDNANVRTENTNLDGN